MPPIRRKRTSLQFPSHIDGDKLPPNVSYRPSHKRFRLAYYDDDNKRRFKNICGAEASLSQIWALVELLDQDSKPALSFRLLSKEFQKSLIWRDLSILTQNDYLDCHKKICGTKSGKGLFGDIPMAQWKTSTVLKYRDYRGKQSKSRANKELSYIKRVLAWAKLYEKIETNVADGVPKLSVPPRQHYADDKDFRFLLQVARESGYWYMPYIIELAYECRMRSIEVLDMTDADETEVGLVIRRAKGSRDNVTRWSDTLARIWREAKAKRDGIWSARKIPSPIDPKQRPIFISERTGDKINSSSLKTAKSRIDQQAKEKAARLGVAYTPFTLHDIKRKSITDTKGNRSDKKEASGHRSDNMLDIYDVSRAEVEPTSGQ